MSLTLLLLRGVGMGGGQEQVVVVPSVPGIEYTLKDNKSHYTLPDNKLHYEFKDED